jgi:hypothetical protein
MSISASLLRLTWSVVEESSNNELIGLSDTMLIKLILQRVCKQILLSAEEVCELYGYLGSKVLLIRDIAQSRNYQGRQLLEMGYFVQLSAVPQL